jgi:predicted alternative tryptophan synthase beta-subunit
MTDYTKILLEESEMPTRWYNIVADLPHRHPPPLHPGTLQPAGADDLRRCFPRTLIEQEVSTQRYIDIPPRGARRLPSVAAPARCFARAAWKSCWIRRRRSSTNTRA